MPHMRRFRGFGADAQAAQPFVDTSSVSLQQLVLQNRMALQTLADHMESDVKTLATAVAALQSSMIALQQDNAALKNQLLAASKGVNVGFTRFAQKPQMQPVGIGVPTNVIRPQNVNIGTGAQAATVQGANANVHDSQADVQMSDADQIFYSGAD